MLTRKRLLSAARLMQTYGELRAGYVDHDSASLQGPDGSEPVSAFLKPPLRGVVASIATVEVEDATTGERRVVLRR
jgi:hypothetical protein